MIPFRKALKYGGYAALVVGILLAIGLVYSYRHGGEDNYKPPEARHLDATERAVNDLKALSQAIETYYVKNLRYPEKLEDLQPDLIGHLPVDPVANKSYRFQTDGTRRYRVQPADCAGYSLKEFYLENGQIVKK
jgi:hypothetical protein